MVIPQTLMAEEVQRPQRALRLIAVSGSKGGVGKSLLAANLGLYLATIGRRVVVVDADPCGATLHNFLGATPPAPLPTFDPPLPSFRAIPTNPDDTRATFSGVNSRERVEPEPPPMPQVERPVHIPGQLMDLSVANLRLLHAGLDQPYAGNTRREPRRELLQRLRGMDAEYVVVDLGAGTADALLDTFVGADVSIFVSLPEPPAIEHTYRFMRSVFARGFLARDDDSAEHERLVACLTRLGPAPAPLDVARLLEEQNDPLSYRVREAMGAFEFNLVINQTRLRADLELGDRMRSAAQRRLGIALNYMGYVDYDDTVWSCMRQCRALLAESPGTKASKSIEKIARRMLALDAGKGPRKPRVAVPPDSHHDLLEVERGATDEEVRRAFKRAKEVYADDALCRHGLFDDQGLEAVRARLEEAYDVLLDPARRRPYELSIFPADVEREERVDVPRDEPLPPAPVLTPDTEFTGPLIRAVRESLGLTVRQISETTKIGSNYVEAIEADDYTALPAQVYVRGFVAEVAKTLRLDHEQVSRSYIKRLRRWVEDMER
ncbi:MAG: helix-turn-helix domain-containing protein [Polyangiales bacterium]|nr:helix-turn-helix domain-containing protein [Myxococcales bacterium]MCB9659052.1 helix-turn-helix domain-containing protein [Sandaracinaceae bacterium]